MVGTELGRGGGKDKETYSIGNQKTIKEEWFL